jgi:hypothetical protein
MPDHEPPDVSATADTLTRGNRRRTVAPTCHRWSGRSVARQRDTSTSPNSVCSRTRLDRCQSFRNPCARPEPGRRTADCGNCGPGTRCAARADPRPRDAGHRNAAAGHGSAPTCRGTRRRPGNRRPFDADPRTGSRDPTRTCRPADATTDALCRTAPRTRPATRLIRLRPSAGRTRTLPKPNEGPRHREHDRLARGPGAYDHD